MVHGVAGGCVDGRERVVLAVGDEEGVLGSVERSAHGWLPTGMVVAVCPQPDVVMALQVAMSITDTDALLKFAVYAV